MTPDLALRVQRRTRVVEVCDAAAVEPRELVLAQCRNAIARRFSVEDINLDVDTFKIAPSKNGYTLSVQYEERASYVADLYLLIAYDRQVEITR